MSVCRHWHAITTSTHAEFFWRALCIDDANFDVDLSKCCDSWIGWCRAYGRHLRDLQVSFARRYQHVSAHPYRPPIPPTADDNCKIRSELAATGFESACIICVQDKFTDISLSNRQLTAACTTLFANSGQLQRLSIFSSLTGSCDCGSFLPRKLLGVMSMASTLESLTLVIPEQKCFRVLAGSVRSLQNLKVRISALQQMCKTVDLRCAYLHPQAPVNAPGYIAMARHLLMLHSASFADIQAHQVSYVSSQAAHMQYLGCNILVADGEPEREASSAAESLVAALGCCPLLQKLELSGFSLRCAST